MATILMGDDEAVNENPDWSRGGFIAMTSGSEDGTEYRTMVQKLQEMHPGWELDIQPPPDGPVSGVARQAGGSGSIRYTFSRDEPKPYLEFYSFHRISGDLHARIYESGELEHLAVLETTWADTGDPARDAQQREELNERNRRLIEELEAAGLLSGGPVPGSFVINAAIVTGVVDAPEPPSPPKPTRSKNDDRGDRD